MPISTEDCYSKQSLPVVVVTSDFVHILKKSICKRYISHLVLGGWRGFLQCTYWPIWALWLLPLYAAEQVLCQFRDQFIAAVDANAIVHDLQHKGIIDSGDLGKITTAAGQTLQNRILYKCLEEKSTDEALMKVCDMIVAVRDNPKMRALGKDMKGMLEGKCYVC